MQQAHDRGLKLVIVSNSDHSIMDHTLRQLDLPFHDVVLAEDAGAYKPDPAHSSWRSSGSISSPSR